MSRFRAESKARIKAYEWRSRRDQRRQKQVTQELFYIGWTIMLMALFMLIAVLGGALSGGSQ